jgi:hypothetical protein
MTGYIGFDKVNENASWIKVIVKKDTSLETTWEYKVNLK